MSILPRLRDLCVCLLAGLSLGGLAGCGASAELTPPSGYIRVREPDPYVFKAVSAQGHVLAIDAHENEDERSTLDFWAAAVEHQKTSLDGFALIDRQPVRSRDGVEGMLFQFDLGEDPDRLVYLVGVFVTPETIYTVEAVGLARSFEEELASVTDAIGSLTFD